MQTHDQDRNHFLDGFGCGARAEAQLEHRRWFDRVSLVTAIQETSTRVTFSHGAPERDASFGAEWCAYPAQATATPRCSRRKNCLKRRSLVRRAEAPQSHSATG